jgi:hypothetical protein
MVYGTNFRVKNLFSEELPTTKKKNCRFVILRIFMYTFIVSLYAIWRFSGANLDRLRQKKIGHF